MDGQYKRWAGYHFLYVGIAVETLPDVSCPYWQLIAPNGKTTLLVALLYQQASYRDSPCYAKIVWHRSDCRTTEDVIAPGGPSRWALSRARRGLKLLKRLPLIGRPPEDRETARQRLVDGAIRLLATHRVIDRPGLANVIPGVESVDGIAELLERADWTLADVRREANKTHTTRRKRA